MIVAKEFICPGKKVINEWILKKYTFIHWIRLLASESS